LLPRIKTSKGRTQEPYGKMRPEHQTWHSVLISRDWRTQRQENKKQKTQKMILQQMLLPSTYTTDVYSQQKKKSEMTSPVSWRYGHPPLSPDGLRSFW
jgi:hypothetical protein